jgi:hypothetical protein
MRTTRYVALAAPVIASPLVGCSGESKAEVACKRHPYSSTARLHLGGRLHFHSSLYPDEATRPVPALSFAQLATSTEVLNGVIDRLKLKLTLTQLDAPVTATSKDQSRDKNLDILITLSTMGADPAAARATAQAEAVTYSAAVHFAVPFPIKVSVVDSPSNARKVSCTV